MIGLLILVHSGHSFLVSLVFGVDSRDGFADRDRSPMYPVSIRLIRRFGSPAQPDPFVEARRAGRGLPTDFRFRRRRSPAS